MRPDRIRVAWPALLAGLALVACSGTPARGRCDSPAACDASNGQRVTVVGTYRALPHPKGAIRGERQPVLARVELAGGGGPYLEPFYKPAAARDPAELARFDGRRVQITGVYHRIQPRNPADPPHAEAMGGPCLEDIGPIVLAPMAEP